MTLEIKRNIFKSSVKMPASYGNYAVPMVQGDLNSPLPTFYPENEHSVRHAPCPRIGEKV